MKSNSKETCPVARVASLLSDKWTMLIVRDVMKMPHRYKDLCDSLTGISTRTLTLKLGKLVDSGVIVKKEPYYQITEKGKKLGDIYSEMTKYGKKYLD
ncbi:MAG: helix-turn-helix transcriptional regulator [Candidatus Pacebacteria bacterium]|nr:helix-turn-helix transcriptional regulator [Candidatus Paceibacterota bacterium]